MNTSNKSYNTKDRKHTRELRLETHINVSCQNKTQKIPKGQLNVKRRRKSDKTLTIDERLTTVVNQKHKKKSRGLDILSI